MLSQEVMEDSVNKDYEEAKQAIKQERVFLRSSPKPIETSTTFPDSLINSENCFDMFLSRDIQKALVFRNFKKLNRDLTKAYLRQLENTTMFGKKGSALPDHQIKKKEQDEETFDRISTLFDKMMKRSRYGCVNLGYGDSGPGSFSNKGSVITGGQDMKSSFKFGSSEKTKGQSPSASTRIDVNSKDTSKG